jgi:hypothetical protein
MSVLLRTRDRYTLLDVFPGEKVLLEMIWRILSEGSCRDDGNKECGVIPRRQNTNGRDRLEENEQLEKQAQTSTRAVDSDFAIQNKNTSLKDRKHLLLGKTRVRGSEVCVDNNSIILLDRVKDLEFVDNATRPEHARRRIQGIARWPSPWQG